MLLCRYSIDHMAVLAAFLRRWRGLYPHGVRDLICKASCSRTHVSVCNWLSCSVIISIYHAIIKLSWNPQLCVCAEQASSAQGVELFEDLLWDIAKLSFAEHVFAPALTYFPAKPDSEGVAESKFFVGDIFDLPGECDERAEDMELSCQVVPF